MKLVAYKKYLKVERSSDVLIMGLLSDCREKIIFLSPVTALVHWLCDKLLQQTKKGLQEQKIY